MKMVWYPRTGPIILPPRRSRTSGTGACPKKTCPKKPPSCFLKPARSPVVALCPKTSLSRPLPPLWLVLVLTCCVPGCVRRRMTVHSNPPGVAVYVDDQQIGTTPVSTDFTYYGTRKIQLIKDGYETLTVQQPFHAPWYQWPPLDFISENLSPWRHRDDHLLNFQLEPQRIPSGEELLDRAQGLRETSSRGYAVALPSGMDTPSPGINLQGGATPHSPPPLLPAPPPQADLPNSPSSPGY